MKNLEKTRTIAANEMNNHKFRVWSKPDNKFLPINVDHYILYGQGDIWFVKKFCQTVKETFKHTHAIDGKNYVMQQFSGILDKNRKEVFNGDIVKFNVFNYHDNSTEEYSGPVTFQDGIFLFGKQEFATNDSNFMEKSIEVIGNVFENPDLLNQNKE